MGEVIGMREWAVNKAMKDRMKADAYVIAARIKSDPRKFKRLMDDLNRK